MKSPFLRLVASNDEMIDDLKEIFISEQGKYFLQMEDGHYKCIYKKLTDTIIEQHLNNKLTLGILPNSNSTTKWLCFDVDFKDFNIVKSIVETLQHHTIKAEMEDSGRKGFHVWIFINGYIENIYGRRLAKFIIDEADLSDDQRRLIEIFPKQDVIRDVGSCIKLPWGIHMATGNETHFLNNIRKPIGFDAWYKQIEKVAPRLIEEILVTNEIKVDPKEAPQVKFKSPKEIMPCVKKYIEDGVKEGDRNKIAFIIATEFRRTGKSKAEAIDTIIAWNKKNKPFKKPYTNQEIENTVNSAYGKYHDREFGCNRDSYILKNCISKDKCGYYSQLRKINPSTGKGFDKKMFFNLAWPKKLTPAASYMYASVIPMLEEEKNITPGGWVFTNYGEISFFLGTVWSYITKILEKLEENGLIEWVHGERGKHHSATKIRRVVPIPDPSDDSL